MSDPTDVPVRDAATVALLRDGASGIEAWMLTRVRGMVFAAGTTVFPGGRVDPADADLPFPAGAEERVGERFGCAALLARALLGAAVRETFEETGVLLTQPPANLADERGEVEAGRLSFGALLRENGLRVDAEALRPWSRWITPVGEVRRYDTRFFVGALPAGAEALDVTTESSAASWVGLDDALERAQRGVHVLLPPTLATLTSLKPFSSVAEAMAAADDRSLSPVRPRLRLMDDGTIRAEVGDGTSFLLPKSPSR